MKLNLKRKAPQEQTKTKRLAVFADSSDSEADEQTAMEAKAAKINREIKSHVLDEDIKDILHQETRQETQEQLQQQISNTPKYLENLLASTNERKQQHLQVKNELAKKSGALVFETTGSNTSPMNITTSDESTRDCSVSTKNKNLSTSITSNLPTKLVPKPTLLESQIKELIRSKLTTDEIMNYKNRYWQRHPERAKLRT
jgi:hypothetical protein